MRWVVLVVLAMLAVGGTLAQGASNARQTEANGEEDEGGWLDALLERFGIGQWEPRIELEVLSVTTNRTKIGGWGDRIEADPGYVFVEVRVLAVNNGTVPLALSTWHFRAEDENGRSTNAEVSMAHHDFDGTAIHRDSMREGLLVFEMREGTTLSAIVWSGEITHARAEIPRTDGI